MPRVIARIDAAAICLAECVDMLESSGFDPEAEDSLLHAAGTLLRLGNDRAFLGDIMLGELKARRREDVGASGYGPQVVMLSRPTGAFFLRANIWPGIEDYALRASGRGAFLYDLPHDHNFHFLTHGYFGPGYWSDYYEYDYADVSGWTGEPVDLRFIERTRLSPGKIMHYRAHRDIHRQLPPDALPVSLNVMHTGGAQGWLDQYKFDLDAGTISGILSHGSSEAFLRIAVGLGSEEALDLADRFGRNHPSDRVRLAAWQARAAAACGDAACDEIWRGAETAGSLLVAHEAHRRRAALSA